MSYSTTKMKNRKQITFYLPVLLLLILTASSAAGKTDSSLIKHDELVLAGPDLGGGRSNGVQIAPEGLTASGAYTSPPITAPLPFTDVGPQWIIDVPAGASYSLELRTGLDGEVWGDWVQVEGELDWMRPETGEWVGDLVPVPQTIRLHNTVQYRLEFTTTPEGEAPLLRQLRFAFIDAGVTPEADTLQAADTYPKPAVVRRTDWGCPDYQESPDWPPEYEPVTHVIVHHTVTPNSDTDYPARVRSIWTYHALSRGWGDIGYNYLVDPNGALYEGRAGGDDVAGGHAYPGNYGSLGLSFIGTYSDYPVPQPMLDSAADLIAWKADQKGIDPYGWGLLVSSDPDNASDRWIRTISGHRDVWYTACPGDVLYGHMPMLRDEVASRLDEQSYIFVDDDEMERSDPTLNWHDGPDDCGYQEHAYWTLSTVIPANSTNWGWWRPNLTESGAYRVHAYVPYCINGYPDSSGVYYTIHHAFGDTEVAVNQAAAAGGWVDLGVYDFNSGTGGYVYLADLADDYNRTVWFDTVKWFRQGATSGTQPPNNTQPADDSWSSSRTVSFQWSASLTEGVDDYRIILATDPELTDLIHSATVAYAGFDWVYAFLNDYPQIYWGVVAIGPNGDSLPSGPWQLGVDTAAPTAGISGVYTYLDDRISVHWSGQDATSGIAAFDVEYRFDPGAEWTRWLTQTSSSGATFPYTETAWFRSRATDVAGHLGEFDDGSMNTADAVRLDQQAWFPLIMRAWPPEP